MNTADRTADRRAQALEILRTSAGSEGRERLAALRRAELEETHRALGLIHPLLAEQRLLSLRESER